MPSKRTASLASAIGHFLLIIAGPDLIPACAVINERGTVAPAQCNVARTHQARCLADGDGLAARVEQDEQVAILASSDIGATQPDSSRRGDRLKRASRRQ